LRIRIPELRIPDPDPGFDELKLKKIYSWKFNFPFHDQKLQFTYPGLHKGCSSLKLQEKPSDLKREHPAPQNMKILYFFNFCGLFLPFWIWIRNLNADPDPGTQINADP
jgi:hypothetical protein